VPGQRRHERTRIHGVGAKIGSADSPVAIVGQSLCRKCMKSGIAFTGGSGS
jgi:DNA polymerase